MEGVRPPVEMSYLTFDFDRIARLENEIAICLSAAASKEDSPHGIILSVHSPTEDRIQLDFVQNTRIHLCAREGVQYTRHNNKNMSCLCKRDARNWSKRKKSQTHSFRSKLKINSPHEQFQYEIEVFNMHTCAILNRQVNSCAERRYPTYEEEYFLHELIASIWSQKVGWVHSDVDDVRMHFCTTSQRLKRTCTYRLGRAFRYWVGIFYQFKILGRRRYTPPERTMHSAARIFSRTRLIHINRLSQHFRIEYVHVHRLTTLEQSSHYLYVNVINGESHKTFEMKLKSDAVWFSTHSWICTACTPLILGAERTLALTTRFALSSLVIILQ